ncbi:UDP-glucuronosyltransferase 1A1-like [Spea bombifrons]|uniref:UDP-glucuronosyltransferase 1A1-like n=1 Tax=Spea bombifrons TaxID=233779 RepID=UPI00234A82BF|nr:UDP-glucuronosyltransferase 1A1-like [Spea bombifrons]
MSAVSPDCSPQGKAPGRRRPKFPEMLLQLWISCGENIDPRFLAFWLSSLIQNVMVEINLIICTLGGKLLVVPMDGSHWLSMKPVTERLTKNGHEVVVLMPESSLSMGNSMFYTVKTFPIPYNNQELEAHIQKYGSSHFIKPSFPGVTIAMFNSMLDILQVFHKICESLLHNKELVQSLREEKYDAVLTDPFSLCGTIVAEYLDIPSVSFLRGMPCSYDYISAQCSSPLSYVPRIFTQYTDKMTFMERFKNVLVRLSEFYYCKVTYLPWNRLASEFLNREVTVLELVSRTSVWLLRYDFVFEYPKPIMPNMVFLGGINCALNNSLKKMKLFSMCGTAFCLLILGSLNLAQGGKLLVVPMDGSHWLSMKPVVEKVAENGHHVVVVMSESSLTINFIRMIEVSKMLYEICESLLHNNELIQNLQNSNFDAVLTDSISICGLVVAEHLGIPSVSFFRGLPCSYDYISAQCPSPLSFVPRLFSQYSDNMTFMQRVKNLLVRLTEPYYCGQLFLPLERLASEFLKKKVTVLQLQSKSSVLLFRYDFVFEFPRPIMPNMVFVGGINCGLKKSLTKVGSTYL